MHFTVNIMEWDIIRKVLFTLASGHILTTLSSSRTYMRSEASETFPRAPWASLRRADSKDRGIPMTDMVLQPHSLAHLRITGTIPVPVPPPNMENTTTALYPWNASLMAPTFSKAMAEASSGSPWHPSIPDGTRGMVLLSLELMKTTGASRMPSDSAKTLRPEPPHATIRTSFLDASTCSCSAMGHRRNYGKGVKGLCCQSQTNPFIRTERRVQRRPLPR